MSSKNSNQTHEEVDKKPHSRISTTDGGVSSGYRLRKIIPKHVRGDAGVVIEDQDQDHHENKDMKLDTHQDPERISGEMANLDPVNIRLECRVIDSGEE